MNAFTTYADYTTKYFGDDVPESSFDKWLSRATDMMNLITFGNISSDDVLAEYSEQISKATCALIDVLYQLDTATKNANSSADGNVKSMSSGGESISFENNKTAVINAMSDKKSQMSLIRDTAYPYLSGTYLMYAGMSDIV